MNLRQRTVLIGLATATIVMLFFPPFHVYLRGTQINMGYGFLFSPPKRAGIVASIDVMVLIVQWLAVIVVSAVAWFIVKDENGSSRLPDSDQRRSTAPVGLERVGFGLLRTLRGFMGFLFVLQGLGLLPAVTWLLDPTAFTAEAAGNLLGKVVLMSLYGISFALLGWLIHWLYRMRYGVSHPALTKALSL